MLILELDLSDGEDDGDPRLLADLLQFRDVNETLARWRGGRSERPRTWVRKPKPDGVLIYASLPFDSVSFERVGERQPLTRVVAHVRTELLYHASGRMC